MKNKSGIITSIDIGTTNTTVLIADISSDINVLGIGRVPSKGLRKGVIVNIDDCAIALEDALEKAQIMAEIDISSAIIGISGESLLGQNSNGVIGITSKNREITQYEVDRVIDAASSIPLASEREIIHILPQDYAVDETEEIRNPIGMSGTRLQCEVHIITGLTSNIDNLRKVLSKCGISIEDVIVNSIAASEATISSDERELGVAVVDIGSSITDIAVFTEGVVWYTSIIPVGGNHITTDISTGLRLPYNSAEEIKRKYGCAFVDLVGEEDLIEIPQIGNRPYRPIKRKVLSQIIEPRAEEIIQLVLKEIEKSNVRDVLGGGIVLTGGNAQVEGMIDIADAVFGTMPVRVGSPRGFTGMTELSNDSSYATSVGLLLILAKEILASGNKIKSDKLKGDGVFGQIKNIFGEFFS